MRLLILAQERHSYTTRRLVEAAKRDKHRAHVLSPTKFRLGFGQSAFVGDEGYAECDVVLARFGRSLQTYGSAVLSQLEGTGVRAFNSAGSIALVRNRIRCLQALVGAELPVPSAVLIRRPEDVDAAIHAVGGLPVLLRRVSGEPTFGALYCETQQSCLAALEALWGLGHEVLLSRHYSELSSETLRCLVVSGQVVTTIRRRVRTFRTRFRIERRGKAKVGKTPAELAALMQRVADVTGLKLCGVDVLQTEQGFKVLEVNAVPGIEQMEMTTGRDLARVVIDHIANIPSPRTRPERSPPRAGASRGKK